jgi:hypothetical protein
VHCIEICTIDIAFGTVAAKLKLRQTSNANTSAIVQGMIHPRGGGGSPGSGRVP